MKIIKICTIILLLSIALFYAKNTYAHQPRVVKQQSTVVKDPEISKAYYAELSGQPHSYTIISTNDFNLYVGVLIPDTKNPKKDVTAEIFRNQESIGKIGGSKSQWKKYFEPFGQSSYWEGGEYRIRATAGEYTIKISSPNNDSRYSLAIGEIEAFDLREGINALILIPDLKRDFFDESPIGFIKSPFGWGYILFIYALAFIFGFIYRTILRKLRKNKPNRSIKNIGTKDRTIRLIISLALLVFAVTTSWNPILLFLSGFALFEAIFSWCGFYTAIGKSTCPYK